MPARTQQPSPPTKKNCLRPSPGVTTWGGGGGLSFKFLRYVVRLAGHVHAGGEVVYHFQSTVSLDPWSSSFTSKYRHPGHPVPKVGGFRTGHRREKKKKRAEGSRRGPWVGLFFFEKKKCRAYATHKKKKKKKVATRLDNKSNHMSRLYTRRGREGGRQVVFHISN